MEAACNRSVLLQESAASFTPSSPRCFWKAGANGRSGRSPGTGMGSGASQHCHAEPSGILRSPSHPIPGAADRQPALPRRARRDREEGRARNGGGSVAACGGFSWAAGNSDSGPGNLFLAGAFSPGGAMCSAGINLSPAHGNCLHLRRLVRREHPPASLGASLSRDLLDLSLRTFPTGGERAAAPHQIRLRSLIRSLPLDYRLSLVFRTGFGGL